MRRERKDDPKWPARSRAEGTTDLKNRFSHPGSAAGDASVFWNAAAKRLRADYRLSGKEIAET